MRVRQQCPEPLAYTRLPYEKSGGLVFTNNNILAKLRVESHFESDPNTVEKVGLILLKLRDELHSENGPFIAVLGRLSRIINGHNIYLGHCCKIPPLQLFTVHEFPCECWVLPSWDQAFRFARRISYVFPVRGRNTRKLGESLMTHTEVWVYHVQFRPMHLCTRLHVKLFRDKHHCFRDNLTLAGEMKFLVESAYD